MAHVSAGKRRQELVESNSKEKKLLEKGNRAEAWEEVTVLKQSDERKNLEVPG